MKHCIHTTAPNLSQCLSNPAGRPWRKSIRFCHLWALELRDKPLAFLVNGEPKSPGTCTSWLEPKCRHDFPMMLVQRHYMFTVAATGQFLERTGARIRQGRKETRSGSGACWLTEGPGKGVARRVTRVSGWARCGSVRVRDKYRGS